MEIVFCGHSIELDDVSWRDDVLDARKRILSIVKRGGLLDSIIDDAQRSGEIDYDLLIYKYLDFESKCHKILNTLTEDKKREHLAGIDVETEFATRYQFLGIDDAERIRLCLYVIERYRIREEKKVLMSEIKGLVTGRFKKLEMFLEIIRPKLDTIEDAETRHILFTTFKEIETGFSQSQDSDYLRKQHTIIRDVEENLLIHSRLVDVMKRIHFQQSNEYTLRFLDIGIDMIKKQREDMLQKIGTIDNEYVYYPISEEFENIGKSLAYLTDQLQ